MPEITEVQTVRRHLDQIFRRSDGTHYCSVCGDDVVHQRGEWWTVAPKPVALYTFLVDGQVHFEHGTLEACIDLIQRWSQEDQKPVEYVIHPYTKED